MRRTSGITLIELLITLAVFGILVSIGYLILRPPAARLLANDFSSALQQARFEAIKRGDAVAVVWDPMQQALVTRVNHSGALSCRAADTLELRVKYAGDYGKVQVSSGMSLVESASRGMLWLPNGLPRTCNAGVAPSTTSVRSHRAHYQVIVSSAGRVRVQRI